MAGFAKTDQFVLSTATVMVGELEDLYELNPVDHTLGLVKNFTVTADPTFTELTQGIQNDVVMSVKTGDGLRGTFEAYEYTIRNMAYAAGVAGYESKYAESTGTFTSATGTSGTSVVCAEPPTGIVAGSWISIQSGIDDVVHVGKVTSVSTNTITLGAAYAIPASLTFPVGSKVRKLAELSTGATTAQASVAMKVTAILPAQNNPVTLLFPKVKITRGFNLNFTSDNFGNMPFEFTPYAPVTTDTFYADFGANKFKLLK